MANTTGNMSDSQDKTGHKLELSEATTKLAEAIVVADPAALRLAADAHATALNSQATAMAASIAEPVYTRLGALADQVRALAEIVANARQADLNWRTEERVQRDAQSTRLYGELDKLIAASEDSARGLGKLEQRMDASEADRADLHRQIEEIKQIMAARPGQREAEHQALLAAIRGHGDGER